MAESAAASEAPVAAAAATAAPETEPTGYMQSNGDFGDNAPDVIRNLMESKKWTNAEQLATGYSELEKFKGGSAIPEADDTEGWAKINSARGVPETFEGYEYKAAEGSPELSPELIGGFKEFAHKLGLSQDQLKGVVDFQLDAVSSQGDVYDQQLQEADQADVEATKIHYGINYENAVNDAKLTSDKHGFSTQLDERGIRNVPIITQMLNHIANLEAEDGINKGAAPVAPKTLGQQMQDIKDNPAFMNKFDKGHKALMVTFNDLNRRIVASRQA